MTAETAAEVTRLLERAFEGTHVGFRNAHGRPNPIPVSAVLPHLMANDDWSIRYRIEQVANEATPWQHGPAFGDLQRWVERHLREPTEVHPPEGTVAFCGGSNYRPTRIVNAVVATRKLILAAAYYGTDEIGRLVVGFLGHGLVQADQFYLLKGFAIESRIKLDDYCTLMPYREMVHYLKRWHTGTFFDKWPDEDANVCVLRATRFEDRFVDPPEEVGTAYGSPLLKHGADHLALLLSLAWGYGLNYFMSQDRVRPAVNASLPFDDLQGMSDGMIRQTELLVIGFGTQDRRRPLPVSELSELAVAYLRHDEPTQRVLNVALRWFRESLTRTEPEDAVISQGVVLGALFGKPGERRDFKKRLSSRGSWYYADSLKERHDTRQLIQDFYDLRSRITHGGVVSNLPPSLTEGISRVLRSSIKSMILHGRPSDWSDADGDGSIRHDPPRSEDVIPSDKADSLSWSVSEQKEIDRQLRRAWESTLAELPNRPADTGGSSIYYDRIPPEDMSRLQKFGIPYVFGDPAGLYMAHPQWPKQPSDELDDRTLYYCSQDIDRHLKSWEQAVLERGSDYIRVKNDAELYHPQHRDRWPQPLG